MSTAVAAIIINYDRDTTEADSEQDAQSILHKHLNKIKPKTNEEVEKVIIAANFDASQLGMPFTYSKPSPEELSEIKDAAAPELSKHEKMKALEDTASTLLSFRRVYALASVKTLLEVKDLIGFTTAFGSLAVPVAAAMASIAKEITDDSPSPDAKKLFIRAFLLMMMDTYINARPQPKGNHILSLGLSRDELLSDIEEVIGNRASARLKFLSDEQERMIAENQLQPSE